MGSNLTDPVGQCGAKNQKMVLTNFVQNDILCLKMNYQHMLQKLSYPTRLLLGTIELFSLEVPHPFIPAFQQLLTSIRGQTSV